MQQLRSSQTTTAGETMKLRYISFTLKLNNNRYNVPTRDVGIFVHIYHLQCLYL